MRWYRNMYINKSLFWFANKVHYHHLQSLKHNYSITRLHIFLVEKLIINTNILPNPFKTGFASASHCLYCTSNSMKRWDKLRMIFCGIVLYLLCGLLEWRDVKMAEMSDLSNVPTTRETYERSDSEVIHCSLLR